ncbi:MULTISPECIES: sensor histidine kinase [Paenibacillus]|uniref:sensor histidine kinase n=1 Tax=Paenibacillus TaxID=44249 RepID=UPI0022B92105|nr:sensor histidine kinase [Paenibacillus caseinilyticus]MCZ8519269.1 sensor histidine kinase [Paenibacillus caseinilyticus]
MFSRTLRPYVAIALLAALFIGLVWTGRLPVWREDDAPAKARQGVLVLDEAEALRRGGVPLSGEWEMYWGKLLTPEDFRESGLRPEEYAVLPGTWKGMPSPDGERPGQGYATYRLRVLLPPGTDDRTLLAMRIPPVNSAYRLWVGGTAVASAGTVGVSGAASRPQYAQAMAVFHPQGGELDIVFQVANFAHAKGGLRQAIELGDMTPVHRSEDLAVGFDALLIGSLLIMGLYHLGLYTARPQSWSMLYFGAFCLLYALRMTLLGEVLLVKVFPGLTGELQLELEYLTAAVSLPLFIQYITHSFPEESSPRRTLLFMLLPAAYAVLVILLPPVLYTTTLIVLQLIICGGSLYIISIVAKAAVRRRAGARVLLFTCLLFFATVISDMLYAHELAVSRDTLSAFGLLFFVFSQSVLLSIKLSRTYVQEEQLTAALTKLNSGLHSKVLERSAELEAANGELVRKNEELSRLETSRSRLLSNISHDLGTPLTTIRCYLEAILDGMVDSEEERERYVRLIHSKVLGMDRLIEDLFQLSQLEAGQVKFKLGRISINHLASLLFGRYELDARNAGIAYELTVKRTGEAADRDAYGIVEADLDRLHQVFSNLIFNAMGFMASGGRIGVLVTDDGHEMRCSVRDTGRGIHPKDLPYVFERYYSGRASRGKTSGGLGLSISKEIVEAHGGRIWVEWSEPDKGTVITFTLPVTGTDALRYAEEKSMKTSGGELHVRTNDTAG